MIEEFKTNYSSKHCKSMGFITLFQKGTHTDKVKYLQPLKKALLVMKLIAFILLITFTQTSANSLAQSVSISKQNISLEEAFRIIQKQTGYNFLVTKENLRKSLKVNVFLKDSPIEEALGEVFKGQSLSYQILNNTIIVRNALRLSFPKKDSESVEEQLLVPPIQITGIVTDGSTGERLSGATIQVKGSSAGTITDQNGTFRIDTDENAVLTVSFVGYDPREVSINGRISIQIELQPSTTSLDQLVVTGYGSERKKDLTGAVSVVNVGNATRQPTGLLSKQLQGAAAGMTVTGSGQPGEEPQVLIRGVNSFGNNRPLYVVDGVPTQQINSLNPNDISSIQVLKDAGAASIYGSRASNGVIIITTKKGKGNLNILYDGFYGNQRPKSGNLRNTLNPMEMAQLKFMAAQNSGKPISASNPDPLYGPGPYPVLPDYIWPQGAMEGDPRVDPSLYYVNPFYTDIDDYNTFYRITRANKEGTDWDHEILKPANIMSHQISVSGSSDKTRYYFSMNYLDQQGLMPYTHFKRYTLRSNSDFQITKNIRIGENVELSLSDNPKVNARHDRLNEFQDLEPIIPVYDIMGNFAGNYGNPQLGGKENPVANQKRNVGSLKTRDIGIFGNIYGEVDIFRHLSFRSSFGGNIGSGYSHSFRFPQYENHENGSSNRYMENYRYRDSWVWTNIMTYRNKFGDLHSIDIMTGTEAYEENGRDINARSDNYYSFDPLYVTLSNGAKIVTHGSSSYSNSLWSQFGRIQYNYDEKYFISGTIRHDGSSKFLNNVYGWFPSVSAAWRIGQEPFLRSANWLSDLKIRGSYGVLGNQMNVNPENSFDTYIADVNGSYYDIAGTNNSVVQGFQRGQIGNPDAKWEKDKSMNIGLDVSLFQNKIQLTVDYFDKSISGLLFNPQLPGTGGLGTPPFVNVGGMSNRGIDMDLSGNFNLSQDIKLFGTLTFSSYKNRVTRVSNSNDYFLVGSLTNIRNQIGHPISSFYGLKMIGYWNSQKEIDEANASAIAASNGKITEYQNEIALGTFKYKDVNGDGWIDSEDRTFIGDPQPKFTTGFNLGVTYRQFDLNFFLYGVSGVDIWVDRRLQYNVFGGSNAFVKTKTALYNSWRPDNLNPGAPIQLLEANASIVGQSSYSVVDGSYLRMRDVELGYNLPLSALNKIGIKSMRLYLQATNLFTLTSYEYLDPEVNGDIDEYAVTNQGIDRGTYPNPKQYIFGINLKF